MRVRQNTIFFLLFAVSGFSGLIYESIWSHYLKLFLGHAAYAQTLVLATFMGGMALGSWICSNYTTRWKNLFWGYALAEGIIGLFALIFHDIFDKFVQYSYTTIIPIIGIPSIVIIFKWTLSALLILPQSVLLGMTFPLMSTAIIRMYPQKSGSSISMLYFTNSIGAAIGVLVSGFILIKMVGLPGTIRLAGVINIAIAVSVWLLTRKQDESSPLQVNTRNGQGHWYSNWYFLLLIASLITGAASFIYEIGWIRMLSLVLGSSTHAFELMLSAFIFGLAFGGSWIQRRIDHIARSVLFLSVVQVIMGLLALSTLPLYENTFKVMQWILKILDKTDTGYTLFNLSSSAIALAVMLPTTFCAGMTLPLITYTLIKQGHGEKSIGAVYAANTIGAIIGVFFAVHLGMPLMGLKGLLIFGAGLDIALGLLLLWNVRERYNKYLPTIISILSICTITATILLVKLDPYKMASGVYRHGILSTQKDGRLIYHKDGKTATISLFMDNSGYLGIRTNGKTDASIQMNPNGNASPDEATMVLLGAIPMAINTQATAVANIGFGSGLTTNTLLTNHLLREVDTIEIEKYMVEAAKKFGSRVELAYKDPRSKIYIDDAKTFFSSHNKKYDIIISEPSNPWVSGVASLFSEEFYGLINRHLAENGLFVQWLQLYEIDMDLIASVMKAISINFSDFVIYAPTKGDIIIVAGNSDVIPKVNPNLFNNQDIAKILKSRGINSIHDIELRKIGNKKALGGFWETFPVGVNSDYYPVLDQNADRARFMNKRIDLTAIAEAPLPILEMLTGTSWLPEDTKAIPTPSFPRAQSLLTAMSLRDYSLYGIFDSKYGEIPEEIKQDAIQLKQIFHKCGAVTGPDRRVFLFNAAKNMAPYLRPGELKLIWEALESGPCSNLLTETEREYISFFKAVGNRDAKSMADIAKILLDKEQDITLLRLRYLVAAGMLGNLAQGNKEESMRLWSEYQTRMFGTGQPGLLFRFLAANSGISYIPEPYTTKQKARKAELRGPS